MARGTITCGIDVGNSKICALIAEQERGERPQMAGVGITAARGLRRGLVVNLEEAVASIGDAVHRAERVSGYQIDRAWLTLSGGPIEAITNRGVVGVSRPDRTITRADAERALETARVISLPPDRRIIHALPQSYIVDGQEGIRNPVGMVGYRLEVDAHVVTAGETAVRNLSECLRQLGIQVQGFVLEPLAAAQSVLSDEDRDMGVALVDIGGNNTSIAIFTAGSVRHIAVIPYGGGNVTNDIAMGLRTPLVSAESLKLEHGEAIPDNVAADDLVQTRSFGGDGEAVSRRQLSEVIEARLEEILSLVTTEIQHAGYSGMLPAGVVLTGGTAETVGFSQLAEMVCGATVRIGRPKGVTGLSEMVRGPAYAAAVGLLLWEQEEAAPQAERELKRDRRMVRHEVEGAEGDTFGDKFRAWLRSFLP